MLSSKSKGLFVEVSSFSLLVATSSALKAPMTIESIKEFPVSNDWEAFRSFVSELIGTKGGRYIPARCAVYPDSRFFRRHTIESAAKAKDPGYFAKVIGEQLRIDLNKNIATVINAVDGSEFSPEKPIGAQKEMLVCGASRKSLDSEQEQLVESGVYPESLELGTLSILGGLIDYMKFKELDRPTLMVEITPTNSNLFIVTKNQVDICRPVPYGLNGMFPMIQEELGLKDEESARKLFYSNTFDFTEMGPTLLRKMLKELQASTGFYEVQTGMTIGQLLVTLLPKNLGWIEEVLSKSLGVPTLTFDFKGWMDAHNIKAGSAVQLDNLDIRWAGLFSMMGSFDRSADGKGKE